MDSNVHITANARSTLSLQANDINPLICRTQSNKFLGGYERGKQLRNQLLLQYRTSNRAAYLLICHALYANIYCSVQ